MARPDAVIVALVCACAVPESPDTRAAAVVDPSPQACAQCHAEVAAQWSKSMHARAWDDPVFRREYDGNPDESCRDCHAPITSAPGRSTGIDCAACHVRDGEVLAVQVTDAGTRAHPMREAPRLRSPEHCGECHQFMFKDDGIHDPAEALQNTLVEYRSSEAYARGDTCQSCHMDRVGHAFAGIHDPEQLARAVDVDVSARRAAGGIDVDVRIKGADIGHAFPTGDVFRTAVLRVETTSGASEEIVMRWWLAQTIDPDGEDLHVRTIDDSRVPAPGHGELRETLRLDDGDAREVTWELQLWRLPPERAGEIDRATLMRSVSRGRIAIAE